MKMDLEQLNKNLDLTKRVADTMYDYYKGIACKYEVLGKAASVFIEMKKEGSLPEQFNFEGFIEWLNGMPEYASNALPIRSSGSYWTALWDCDYISEKAEQNGIPREAVEKWIGKMDDYCRAGWQGLYYLMPTTPKF